MTDGESEKGGFVSYRKVGTVYANFAGEAGEIATLEGKVRYLQGDVILTGVEGERWPVSRKKFEAMYAPAEAIKMGQDGRYAKTVLVQAKQMGKPFSVEVGLGDTLSGGAGDWLVIHPDGGKGVVADRIFNKTYIKASHGED